MSTFIVKDSGARQEFASGMVRDTAAGKAQFHRVLEGPMFERWAEHLTKGAAKYPDSEDGTANWTKASGTAESRRFKESALRHFIQWYKGESDEDHASAVFFNINGYEYVQNTLMQSKKTWQNIKDNSRNEGLLNRIASQSGGACAGPNSSGSRF